MKVHSTNGDRYRIFLNKLNNILKFITHIRFGKLCLDVLYIHHFNFTSIQWMSKYNLIQVCALNHVVISILDVLYVHQLGYE